MTAEQTPEVLEGEAQEVGQEMELAVAPAAPATLFRTDDPTLVLERATEVANALADVINKRKLFVNIHGKSHVLVEGWLTLGSMLGVTAVCEWTRPIENGWEARVVAQTLDGRTIGAAESQCLSTEGKPWNTAEGYAIRSMAQTRATSKALASVLRFVVTLAGYSGTPAEEMHGSPAPQQQVSSPPAEVLDSDRVDKIIATFGEHQMKYRDIGLALGAAGIDGLRANSAKAVRERIESLAPDQADALEAVLHA